MSFFLGGGGNKKELSLIVVGEGGLRASVVGPTQIYILMRLPYKVQITEEVCM